MRLDQLLAQRGLAPSRERARALILAGRVRVEGTRVDKAGTRIASSAAVDVLQRSQSLCLPRWPEAGRCAGRASRWPRPGGPSSTWAPPPAGSPIASCRPVPPGSSPWMSGHGQLDWTLRQDPRVLVVERCNARELTPQRLQEEAPAWDGHLDLAVVDVSFISLDLILPALATFPGLQRVIALVKPQFEAGRRQVGRGGIVRDPGRFTPRFCAPSHCRPPLTAGVPGP